MFEEKVKIINIKYKFSLNNLKILSYACIVA